MKKKEIKLVSISCITFNHGPFIKECLDGFLMQVTDFEYEILVHDDASTDNTADIIREYASKYPNLIKPIFQTENQYSKGQRGMNSKFNFPRAQGKYIALCEGDDYWTDPYKLQKQVDFLEANLDYVLVGSYANIHKGNIVQTPKNIEFRTFDFHDTARGVPIPTLTFCFRNEYDFKNFNYPVGDMGILFEVSKNGGKMGKLPFVSAVYNYHGGGVNSGKSRFDNKKLQVETLYLMGKRTDDYYFKFIIRWGFLMFIIRELKEILLFRQKNYNTFFLAVIYFFKK